MGGVYVLRPSANDSTKPLSISLPNGTTSLSLPSSFGSAAVVLTTVEIPAASLPTFAPPPSNTTSAVGNAPAPQLLSSVLTIEISQSTINGSFEAVPIPYFEANIQLSAAANQSVSTNVLVHNCTVGVPESVSIFCADTGLRMNLTCSGRVAIAVHRQCPLPRAVCSIVDLSNNRIVSNDFCSAVKLGSSVVCKCGGAGSNSSSIGAVNRLSVGVFEVYGAGSFASSVVLASTLSVSDVAARSVSIFVFFGSLWGIGLSLLCVVYWDVMRWRKLKRTAPNERDVERPLEGQESRQELLRSILPPFFDTLSTSSSTGSWVFKGSWGRALIRSHPYLRVCWEIYQRIRGKASEDKDHVAQDIIHELTAVTTACCVLAMLFDFQYPEDNGFCAAQTSLETCEDRKMLLDPFQNQCLWRPPEQTSSDTGDFIEELVNTRLTNKVYLSDAMNNASPAACHFNGSNSSTLAFILSYLITSMFQIILRLFLERLMRILSAREQLAPPGKRETVESDSSREDMHLRAYPLRKVERLRGDRRVLEGAHLLRRNAVGAIGLMGESPQLRQLTPVVCTMPPSIRETKPELNLAVQRAAETMTSTDYAVTMLRLAVADLIGCHSAQGRHVFLLGLFRAFPVVESFRYLWLWHYLTVAVLMLCNAGSLYFIVSKAAIRRFQWQVSFLKIVAFEWFSDVVVLQSLEVACLDYGLCRLVQKEVEETIQQLLLVPAMAKDEQLKRPSIREAAATDDFESPSNAMARQWPGLPESRWVQSIRSPGCEVVHSTKRRLLKWLTYGSLETWETTISFVSTFMLAWLVFMYYRFVDEWFMSLPPFVYGVIAGVSLVALIVFVWRMYLMNQNKVKDDGNRESDATSGSLVWSLSSESLASSWDLSASLSSNDDDLNSLHQSSSSLSMVDKSLSFSFAWSDGTNDSPSNRDFVLDESDDFDGPWDRCTSGEEGDDIDTGGTDFTLSHSAV